MQFILVYAETPTESFALLFSLYYKKLFFSDKFFKILYMLKSNLLC